MNDEKKTKTQLINELVEMRRRVSELRETEPSDKKANEELHTNENRFHKLFQDMPSVAVQGYGSDGTTKYWNHASELLYGYSAQEAIGQNLVDLIIPQEARKEVKQTFKDMVESGHPIPASELSLIRKDGTQVIVFSSHSVIQMPGCEPEMFCMDIDLTAHKQALAEIQKLSKVIETTSQATVIINIQGEVVYVNKGLLSMLGFEDNEEILGKSMYSFTDKDGIRKLEKEIIPSLISTGHWCGEINNKRKDGAFFPVEEVCSIIKNEQNQPEYFVAVFSDITKRKQAEEAQAVHVRFLENMERIDRVIQIATDIEQMMSDVLQTTLEIFQCDRAWLLYPCDPKAESWRVPMMRTRPEYRSDEVMESDVPIHPDDRMVIQAVLEADVPVGFGSNNEKPLPEHLHSVFGIRTQMAMAVYPKTSKPWMFGMHQCTHYRDWTDEERNLFNEIGRRIGDALNSLLILRDLRKSENNLRTLFNAMTDVVFEIDYNGIYINIAPTSPELLFKPPEEIIGKSLHDVFPKPEAGRFLEFIRKCIDKNEIQTIEYPLIIKDKTIWFEGRATPKTKNSVLYIARDVTERKKGEKRIRDNFQQIEMINANVPNIIWKTGIDENGNFINTYISEVVNEFLALPKGTINNSWGGYFSYIVPKYLPSINKILQQSIENPGMLVSFDYEVKKANGKTAWFSSKGRTQLENNKLTAYGSTIDITERKQAEKDKAKLETQLRRSQKLETIGTMAGGIAHDFNNILAPIMGFTELALLKVDETEPIARDLDQVLKGAQRAKGLVEQILLFSKQSEKERQPLALQSLIKEALKLLRPSIPSTIEIQRNINASCAKVWADATQIHQVIVNLCANAWQAMEQGGTLTIELKQVKVEATIAKLHPNLNEAEYACLSVIDNGCGMDEQILDRIFEPFFTTKAVDKGTGLGLSVVHGIVRGHRGDILVYSEPEKGSAFHVYLPIIQAAEETLKATSKVISGGTEFIMIVDDEPAIAEMVKMMLENFGYKADVFKTGLAAIEAYKQQPDKYDLLLSDLTMPQMTGLDLADQLHNINPEFPVVIMTGFGDSITSATREHYDIKQVLGKPVAVKELAKTVRKILDK